MHFLLRQMALPKFRATALTQPSEIVATEVEVKFSSEEPVSKNGSEVRVLTEVVATEVEVKFSSEKPVSKSGSEVLVLLHSAQDLIHFQVGWVRYSFREVLH